MYEYVYGVCIYISVESAGRFVHPPGGLLQRFELFSRPANNIRSWSANVHVLNRAPMMFPQVMTHRVVCDSLPTHVILQTLKLLR